MLGKYKTKVLTALPDTRSWQVPKAYRVSTPESAVRQPAGRNVYNPCHTGFPAHTPGGVLKGCGSSRTRFAWLMSYRSIFTVAGALRGSFSI